MFLFHEGSQAVDAKNFFLQQPELSHVTLEGQTYFRDPKKQIQNKQANKLSNNKDDKNKEEL